MPRSEFAAWLGGAWLCGFVSAFALLFVGICLEPPERRTRAKVYMLNAMNYADNDARWRLKQFANAMKMSPLQTMEEIRMYEEMGAFPDEYNHTPVSQVNVPSGAP
jgi:hypothetical protein